MISMTAKAPMIDTGTAISGISVVRSFPRNRKTTIATSTKAMTSVRTTSATVDVTNTVASQNIAYSTSSGKRDRKSTRLNSSHLGISYAVFCLKKKKNTTQDTKRKIREQSSA